MIWKTVFRGVQFRNRSVLRAADTCCRVARSQRCMSEQLVLLSALCALEAVPLGFSYFAGFWKDVASTPVSTLPNCSEATIDLHKGCALLYYTSDCFEARKNSAFVGICRD